MKKYTWGGYPCVRCEETFEGESHPCYYCGIGLADTDGFEVCEHCGFGICPSCGKCWCNTPEEQKIALRVLRDKYCCNIHFFRLGLVISDKWLLKYVPHFEYALNYCKMVKEK